MYRYLSINMSKNDMVARGLPITRVRRDLCRLVADLHAGPIAIMRDGKVVALLVAPNGKDEVVKIDAEKNR